jgi:hypothetical protein
VYISLIPEEDVSPEEIEELKALKLEAERGECVPLEEVLKKHGVKQYNSRSDHEDSSRN